MISWQEVQYYDIPTGEETHIGWSYPPEPIGTGEHYIVITEGHYPDEGKFCWDIHKRTHPRYKRDKWMGSDYSGKENTLKEAKKVSLKVLADLEEKK